MSEVVSCFTSIECCKNYVDPLNQIIFISFAIIVLLVILAFLLWNYKSQEKTGKWIVCYAKKNKIGKMEDHLIKASSLERARAIVKSMEKEVPKNYHIRIFNQIED